MSAHIQTVLRELAKEAMGPTKLKINSIVRHPTDGIVKIVDGQYWGEHGISNFWYWQEIKPDGSLGERKSGYGWM
jgi:hypothetical protein